MHVNPDRGRLRAPLANHLRAGPHQGVVKTAFREFALPHQGAPTGIPPKTQRLSGFRSMLGRDAALEAEAGHTAVRPFLARFDVQMGTV